jgi:uncharacterized protein (DUF1778 family)
MTTATPNQTRRELETSQVIKLSSNGQKRFEALSKNPPAPTVQMKRLKNLQDFTTRRS